MLEWMALPQHKRARSVLVKKLCREGLEAAYTHVRAFHGCRPTDIPSYLRHGIRPLSRETVVADARRLLLGKGRPPVTRAILAKALRQVITDRAYQGVYLAVDERHLMKYAGHYMVYGSEALAAVAAILTTELHWNVQALLLEHGTPTVFVADVPCGCISSADLVELRDAVVEELGCTNQAHPSDLDLTLRLARALPSTAIRTYYSIPRVHDPLRWREYVHRGQTSP